MTTRGASLFRKLAADFTARWWVLFVLVIVLPSLALSVVSLRLIDRLAQDEVANLIRASEAVPWYMEQKMSRALEAQALHAARGAGYETSSKKAVPPPTLFEVLRIDAPGANLERVAPADALIATASEESLSITDGRGQRTGTLRYRYTTEGLKAVLRECFNDLRAPWNDDSIEVFIGGSADGHFGKGFDLHLNVRVDDAALWERQGRGDREPVSRATLLREVWSAKKPASARTVDVHVTHLRNKLGATAARHIVTIHGIGYTFVEA